MLRCPRAFIGPTVEAGRPDLGQEEVQIPEALRLETAYNTMDLLLRLISDEIVGFWFWR